MNKIKKYIPIATLVAMFFVTILVWHSIYISKNSKYLKVVFLDVGQGDSIYIECPNRKQVLIDGGRDAKLLSSLAKVMPFSDRSIDLLLVTHPDIDHIGGLPALLESYRIDKFISSGEVSDSSVFKSLEEKTSKDKIEKFVAFRGMKIVLDEENQIYLEVIFPDRDIDLLDANEGSVVVKLIYKEKSFLFMGDANLYTENLIMWNEKTESLDVDVLKLGHHGARSSSSLLWLEATSPDIAVISAGKDNSYGHPHKEVLDRLNKLNIPFLSTIEKGNIIFKTDGVELITSL